MQKVIIRIINLVGLVGCYYLIYNYWGYMPWIILTLFLCGCTLIQLYNDFKDWFFTADLEEKMEWR